MTDVQIPKLGMSTVDVDVLEWHVEVGDVVEEGAPLAELESEKTTMTLEAPVRGEIVEILVPAGEIAEVGAVVCRIDETA